MSTCLDFEVLGFVDIETVWWDARPWRIPRVQTAVSIGQWRRQLPREPVLPAQIDHYVSIYTSIHISDVRMISSWDWLMCKYLYLHGSKLIVKTYYSWYQISDWVQSLLDSRHIYFWAHFKCCRIQSLRI